MRTIAAFCAVIALSATAAEADPYTILPNGELAFNVTLRTEGIFTCPSSIPCVGTGTSSITLGTDPTLTVTFNGNDQSLQIPANDTTVLNLGEFVTTASGDGFTFPERRNRWWPVFWLDLMFNQSSPVPGSSKKTIEFAMGGKPTISGYFVYVHSTGLPIGTNPPGFEYQRFIYEMKAFQLPGTTARTQLNARVSAIPEPATLVLAGSGLLGALYRRRTVRKRSALD